MTLDFLVSSFVTLLVVVDPVSLAPIFVVLTRGLSAREHKRIALNACLLAGVTLCGVALIGDWLLAQLGITLPAFRVAGGLLLFAVAFDMVLGWRSEREGKEAEEAVHKDHARRLAAFPLAIPLMAGPGAITATLLLAGRGSGSTALLLMLLGVIIAVVTLCFAVYLSAVRLSRLLGTTANLVFSRLLGVILAALAVQYVIDGVRAVWAM
ncbi:MAG TPA: MarC family protein [Xanthobacteraceae bacterium]|jgi:multiple antibiotic resistance protein